MASIPAVNPSGNITGTQIKYQPFVAGDGVVVVVAMSQRGRTG